MRNGLRTLFYSGFELQSTGDSTTTAAAAAATDRCEILENRGKRDQEGRDEKIMSRREKKRRAERWKEKSRDGEKKRIKREQKYNKVNRE